MEKKSKSKLSIILGIVMVVLIVAGAAILLVKARASYIPNNYIAVFHGGVGEETRETYIYKVKNGQANLGFKYINVTSRTKSWGSSEWDSTVTEKGRFAWTDDAFAIAEKNGAYEYVTKPNDEKTYSISEFAERFLLN